VICIKFDGDITDGADSVEDAMGGAQRELISLAALLCAEGEVRVYLKTRQQWRHGDVHVLPVEEFTWDVLDSTAVYIGNLLLADDYPRVRQCLYQWIDYAEIHGDVDLVITDTWRGKIKYTGQGRDAVVLFPYVEPNCGADERDASKILFVGAIHGGKRPDLAIEAMSLLPNYTLHVIGRAGNPQYFGQQGVDADAAYYQQCRDVAGDNVVFRGELPYSEMLREMQTASAIIIPYCSVNEFNTNVALEAISNGCVPVVADGLVDYLSDRACIRLPNQQWLSPEHIADIFLSQKSNLEEIRLNAMTVAGGIANYCKGEMIRAILGKT